MKLMAVHNINFKCIHLYQCISFCFNIIGKHHQHSHNYRLSHSPTTTTSSSSSTPAVAVSSSFPIWWIVLIKCLLQLVLRTMRGKKHYSQNFISPMHVPLSFSFGAYIFSISLKMINKRTNWMSVYELYKIIWEQKMREGDGHENNSRMARFALFWFWTVVRKSRSFSIYFAQILYEQWEKRECESESQMATTHGNMNSNYTI